MGIVIRQSVKTTMVVALGALLGALVIWLSTNFIPDKHEFGFIQDITNRALTLTQVAMLGLNSTLVVYIHRYAREDRKRSLLLTLCLGVPLIAAVAGSIVYFVLRAWIIRHFQPMDVPIISQFFGWLPVYTLLYIYQTILEQYLGSQMRVAVAAFMREVVIRIINIVIILLFATGYIDFKTLVAATVLMYLVTVIIFSILSLKTQAFGLSFRFRTFSRSEYKELIHFSWYHFLLGIVMTMMNYMDMLLLPFYDHNGLGSLAVYRVAIFLVALLQMPSRALLPASFTALARAFADKEMDKARDFFNRASINILIPTVAMGLLLCCNLDNAVAVIRNGYAGIAPVFLILLIGRLVDLSTGMNDQVLSIANYYKFNFYLSLSLMVLFFVLMKMLVPRYSIYGAAWSTTICFIVFNVVKYFFVKRKLGMQPFSPSTLLVLVAALPALATGYFFPYLFNPARHVYIHTFLDAIIRSILILGVYFVMLLWLKPSKDLQEYLSAVKKNKRLY